MGRPRVPDSERRRAAVACSYCRTTKKKCSATMPCVHCQRRGIAASCSFSNSASPISLAPTASSFAGPAVLPSPSLTKKTSCSKSAGSSSALPVTVVPHSFRTLTPETVLLAGSAPDVVRLGHTHKKRRPGKSVASAAGSVGPMTSVASVTSSSSPPRQARRRSSVNHATSRTKVSSYSSSGPEALTRPRFLFNLRGEQVFIGQAASLSFLQLAREIVSEHIGPSEFSHNGKIQTMLETASPIAVEQTPVPAPDVSLDVDQMISHANTFNASVDGLMDLFAPSEIEGLLIGSNATDARYRNPYKRATIDLIIAIGAQCMSPESDANVSQRYFRHAQQLAVSETLEDPNVDMIRAFLLMAFYMLGSCRRNAAFMYIGIATRAAVVLGLHSRDSYTDMSLPRFLLRLRIWVSLCNLDMTVSAILGRPAATAMLRADLDKHLDQMAANMHGTEMDLGVLMASYKILSIISDIVDNLYGRNTVPGAFIEQYLDAIEVWKHDYGAVIQDANDKGDKSTHGTASSADKAGSAGSADNANNANNANNVTSNKSIGKVHASCFYYFAVTLVTRPILILTLVVQSDGIRATWSQMAQACVEASTYLVQTCVDAQDAGILLGNMCILKALVFVAGLTLGLQSFSKQQIDYEVETAFAGAQRNLEFLAVQSPQASHYLEILRLLQTSITKQRQQHAEMSRSRYVSKIYATESGLHHNPNTATAATDATAAMSSPHFLCASSGRDMQFLPFVSPTSARESNSPWTLVEPTDEMLFNWDHLDLSQWDDFLLPNAGGGAIAADATDPV